MKLRIQYIALRAAANMNIKYRYIYRKKMGENFFYYFRYLKNKKKFKIKWSVSDNEAGQGERGGIRKSLKRIAK